MTCDELFDLLTGESRADSRQCRDSMKRHVARCRSCRRLADALEPAVELFRECSAGDELSAPALMSGPWNEPQENEPARDLHRHQDPWFMALVGGDLMRLAAAIMVGLTLGALFWGRSESPSQARETATLAISAAPSGRDPGSTPRVTLASLRVTAACIPVEHRPMNPSAGPHLRPAGELLAAADLDGLACCTSCHASLGMASRSKSATLQVIRSCQACHTF